ncbi:hypothetical protein ACHQM5_019959 [Ranunculus cassubicifolius]
MATKISNFTDLIQRFTASCLLNPLIPLHEPSTNQSVKQLLQYAETSSSEDEEIEPQETPLSPQEPELLQKHQDFKNTKQNFKKLQETEALMAEIFDSVSDLKKAYVSLQEAHSPWDPVKMSVADAEVVKELKRIGRLKDKFRRMGRSGGGGGMRSRTLREAVAPYEETVEELRREVKAKEAEVVNLKEKLRNVSGGGGGKKGKFQSRKKLNCSQGHHHDTLAIAPVPELFETTMSQVKETSKSLTSLLLSRMRSARWDIAAAVRSIESGTNTPNDHEDTTSTIGSHHAKYALESYIYGKFFQGFDHETFYIDGSLSSLLNPEQYRRDSFTRFRDMNSMDPTELLGISPTCQFGIFCSRKYLSIVHPKMEESLFGDLEQNRLVSAGNHPRSEFYGQFLKVAKAVWLLHLLAFSLDPTPSLFLAAKGSEFQPDYMESVVRTPGIGLPMGQTVGIPISPGFKLGNGLIIKARVYLFPRS